MSLETSFAIAGRVDFSCLKKPQTKPSDFLFFFFLKGAMDRSGRIFLVHFSLPKQGCFLVYEAVNLVLWSVSTLKPSC